MRARISIDRLRSVLRYDQDTGELRWLVTRGKAKAGALVSCADARGYIVLGIDGVRHYAHRVAWALATGSWPDEVIDHIDGDRGNNRLDNLRAVSIEVNAQNRHVPSARSATQVLGVGAFKGKFRATISIQSKQRHLGTFNTAEEASAAYLSAKRMLHEGCTL